MRYFASRLFWIVITAAVYAALFHPAILGHAYHGAAHEFDSVVGEARATSFPTNGSESVAVGFSPGNAEDLVVQAIDQAQKSIDVAAYSFTSRPIAAALVRAARRGAAVRAVLDRSQSTERYSSATFLANAGVPVRIDNRYAIMHNKFLVIDGVTVETGSFNFTRSAARRNAENVLILRNARPAAQTYANEWQRLWAESAPYAASY